MFQIFLISNCLELWKNSLAFLIMVSLSFASSLYFFGYIFQVACHLKKQKCDIVHILNFSQYIPIIRMINPDIKIVLHMVCEWLTQLDRSIIERRLNKSDLIIGCSEYITDKIKKRFPQVAHRCITVYNGVDTDVFAPKNNNKGTLTKRLLSVGRMSPEKGLHVLIKALPKIIKRFPKVQCDIVGPKSIVPKDFLIALSDDNRVSSLSSFYQGNYSAHLRNQVTALNLADHVKFSGAIPFESLVTKYQTSHMLVQPSLSDAFPLPVVEAMACGLPVIGTLVGGIPESIENGKEGLVVEAGDAAALAEGIICLLENEDLRESMGKAARRAPRNCFPGRLLVKIY